MKSPSKARAGKLSSTAKPSAPRPDGRSTSSPRSRCPSSSWRRNSFTMTELCALVAEELSLPVDPRVTAVAEAIAAKHAPASRAVLFYGSCLRQRQLEGLMLDFYLIVSDYRTAYPKRWLAAANRLIPPNVFYFEHDGLAAKYAVLSEADFRRLNGPETSSVSVWARFAQPARLVWTADEQARDSAIDAVSRAAPTLLAAAGAID